MASTIGGRAAGAASIPDVALLQTSAIHSPGRVVGAPKWQPAVLSPEDVQRYQQIFALQEEGEWADADREIKQLQSRVLMGHVLRQRYMHPTDYRSRYDELKGWLADYADHPGAERIYSLALRRKPAKTAAPKAPDLPRATLGYADTPDEVNYRSPRKRSKAEWREVRRLQKEVKSNLREDRLSVSQQLLKSNRARNALDPIERDELLTRIAAGWYFYGKNEKALKLASEAAKRSRKHIASADWYAGLAAWRLGKMRVALRHFEALVASDVAGDWTRAAGAFWAARAALAARQPKKVNPLLKIAAEYPRTFYGQIASRQLGKELNLQWSPPPLNVDGVRQLEQIPGVRRAIALVQVGRFNLAERELKAIYLGGSEELGGPLLALAHRLRLPAIQLRLARGIVAADSRPYDQALFPVPPWRPREGFEVDQALLFAFMRQESGFDAKAESHVGARGLMQLMPRTASYVAGDKSLRRDKDDELFDPEFNLELGQKYIDYLLRGDVVKGDLFKLAVAYNAGPGNLRRWLREVDYKKDPLLFIESLPSRETRIFVERVLANFWIYRERLGQDTPSLDAVATGYWPIYLSLDTAGYRLAGYARN